MPVRVSPSDRTRHHIDELFAQDRPLPEILDEAARLGAQLLMQAADRCPWSAPSSAWSPLRTFPVS